MKEINIKLLDTIDINPSVDILSSSNNINIEVNINFNKNDNITYDITSVLKKVKNILKTYNKINNFNIEFDKKISKDNINKIIPKLNDILYRYYPSNPVIKINNVSTFSQELMNELTRYKDIVMDPNKNPDTYLKYVLSRIPKQYKADVFKIKKGKTTKMFHLTHSVGAGSSYNSYFVHIKPKYINPDGKDIYMIGKAVTYDSGGMDLKMHEMNKMKTDMTGSAILLSVINLLKDTKDNIHLLLPIVENMIGNTATRPGMVIETMNGKKVEVTNTDAEGRLCIADAMEYISLYLIKKNKEKSIILDIATLTGNVSSITNGMSSIVTSNDMGMQYVDIISKIGEDIGEYVDNLKVRKEHMDLLNSKVADVVNLTENVKAGCIMASAFIKYFTDPLVPWIHIDIGCCTFTNNTASSYGILLLYNFLRMI